MKCSINRTYSILFNAPNSLAFTVAHSFASNTRNRFKSWQFTNPSLASHLHVSHTSIWKQNENENQNKLTPNRTYFACWLFDFHLPVCWDRCSAYWHFCRFYCCSHSHCYLRRTQCDRRRRKSATRKIAASFKQMCVSLATQLRTKSKVREKETIISQSQ